MVPLTFNAKLTNSVPHHTRSHLIVDIGPHTDPILFSLRRWLLRRLVRQRSCRWLHSQRRLQHDHVQARLWAPGHHRQSEDQQVWLPCYRDNQHQSPGSRHRLVARFHEWRHRRGAGLHVRRRARVVWSLYTSDHGWQRWPADSKGSVCIASGHLVCCLSLHLTLHILPVASCNIFSCFSSLATDFSLVDSTVVQFICGSAYSSTFYVSFSLPFLSSNSTDL